MCSDALWTQTYSAAGLGRDDRSRTDASISPFDAGDVTLVTHRRIREAANARLAGSVPILCLRNARIRLSNSNRLRSFSLLLPQHFPSHGIFFWILTLYQHPPSSRTARPRPEALKRAAMGAGASSSASAARQVAIGFFCPHRVLTTKHPP